MGLIAKIRQRRRERYKSKNTTDMQCGAGCAGLVNAVYGTQQAMYNRTGGYALKWQYTTSGDNWKCIASSFGNNRLLPIDEDCKCPTGDVSVPVATSMSSFPEMQSATTVFQCFKS